MNNIGSPPTKRMRLSGEELTRISKDEIIELYMKQQELVEELRGKSSGRARESSEKRKLAETTRRENVLVMRLATKEQELQQYAAQISHIKKSQEEAAAKSLREALLDPAVNLLFDKMRDELKETKDKLEQAQSELSAWKFTPDSQTGKKLMSRCRTLIAENQELGRQLSQGTVAQLQAELALQKKYSEDLKESQEELNEFVIQLDEEVEGMQSTIQLLQQQLTDARRDVEKYKKLTDGMDLEEQPRTKEDRNTNDVNSKPERDLSTSVKENKRGKVDQNFVKTEVGVNGINDPANGPCFLDERSFEISEFVCKEECDSDGETNGKEHEGADENETLMEVDGDRVIKGVIEDRDGQTTPTFSEHEIIDESQGSTPEGTPERDSVEIEGDSVGIESGEPSSIGSAGRDESPMNDETYAVIDNGSEDETEHVVQIVSTHDELDNKMGVDNDNEKAPRTPEGDFIESLEKQESLDYDETNPEEETEEQPSNDIHHEIVENDDDESAIPQESETRTTAEAEPDSLQETVEETTEVETSIVALPSNDSIDAVIQPVVAETAEAGAFVQTSRNAPPEMAPAIHEMQQPLPAQKFEVQPPTMNGPHAAGLPTLPHSMMTPTQVPLMGDPTAYLMNPHFPHISGAALAQQQAIMAEQASLFYKTMLAQQQQQQHLAMAEDKNAQLPDGAGMPKPAEEFRTPMNPLMHGMPYADPQAAFLAQYKAMLAAQSMFVPSPDGKTQMIAPGGLGLYPGLPMVQPTVMSAAQPNAEHSAISVPSSWPTSTNVTYAPHPLMHNFLGPNPAGMMLYPGHNLTPQPVAAAPAVIEMDKHHGSGDHGPIPNGMMAQKTQEHADTNPPKEEPQMVA